MSLSRFVFLLVVTLAMYFVSETDAMPDDRYENKYAYGSLPYYNIYYYGKYLLPYDKTSNLPSNGDYLEHSKYHYWWTEQKREVVSWRVVTLQRIDF